MRYDQKRIKKTYSFYRQRPVFVDLSSVTVVASGSGDMSDPDASYVVLSLTASLNNERSLGLGSGLTLTDNGANSTVVIGINNNIVATTSGSTFTQLSGSLQKTADGVSYLVGVGGVSITSQSNGQVFISSSLAGAPTNATYVTLSSNGELTNERVLTNGGGITVTDGGFGGTATLGIDNATIATISGSTFTQLSGSLQRTAGGLSFLVAAGALSITTQSNGQIVLSASGGGGPGGGAPADATYLTLSTNGDLSNERVLTAGGGVTVTDGGAGSAATLGIDSSVIATISGSTFTQLSGSLQRTSAGLSYLVAAGGIAITSGSSGQIVISGSGPTAPGADREASYVVVSTTSSLPNERSLAVGSGITLTDGGVGSTLTLGINNGVVATISGSTFTQLSGTLQRTASGLSYLVAGNSISVTTQSNGQILISLTQQDPTVNGFRLTLSSSTPIASASITSGSTLYLTPYRSGRISLYDGTSWIGVSSNEVSMSLAGLTSTRNYDVFVYPSGTNKVPALELSTAWTNDVVRGFTLTQQDGVFVKGTDTTRRYIGTIRTTSTTTSEDSVGRRLVWNAYNQGSLFMSVVDTNNTWTYASPNGVFRVARSSSLNGFEYVCGMTTQVQAKVHAFGHPAAVGAAAIAVGVGVDSTSVNSAVTFGDYGGRDTASEVFMGAQRAEYQAYSAQGFHRLYWLETGQGAGNFTFYGNVGLAGMFQCGMFGDVQG